MVNQNKIIKIMANAHQLYSTTSSNVALKSYAEIPGPMSLPLVGNLFSYKEFGGELKGKEFDKFVIQLNEKYGDIVKWSLFGQNSVFIFKTDYAKQIYKNESSTPSRPQVLPWVIYSKKRNFPSGLINSQGKEWKNQRSASNPIVGKPLTVVNFLNSHNLILNDFIDTLNRSFSTNQSHILIEDFNIKLKLLTLEMMMLVAFDKRLNAKDDQKSLFLDLFKAIEVYGEITCDLYYSFPFWKFFTTKDFKKFEKVSDFIFGFARKVIYEAHDSLSGKKLDDISENSNLTLLQQFILNQKTSNLSLDEIIAIMFEFLLGSYETTTNTLHFVLYELALNQDIQEEIHKEIAAFFTNETCMINEDHLSKIPLLKATLKESQRLNGLAPIIGRVLDSDLVLDDYLIPKGTTVNIGLSVMSKSEKYFKNALNFQPKRWLKSTQDSESPIDPFSFLPFGFGARMCIGRRLAEQKIYLILIKLIKNYKIEYVGKQMRPKFRLVFLPDQDLSVKLTRR